MGNRMRNAQWNVQFQVEVYNVGTLSVMTLFNKSIYLASPDLLNTKEAHKRARVTARKRFDKWFEKNYTVKYPQKAKVTCVEVRCVG